MLQIKSENEIMGESEKMLKHPSDPIQRPVRRSPVPDQDSTTRLIPLTQGKFAIVDASDYECVSKYKWHAEKRPGTFYAKANWRVGKKTFSIRMHVLLMRPEQGLTVDHADGDGLNNSRSNLRIASYSQNLMNSRRSTRNTSGFKGVSRAHRSPNWAAFFKHKYLGAFPTKELAHAAYVEAAKLTFGEFVRTK